MRSGWDGTSTASIRNSGVFQFLNLPEWRTKDGMLLMCLEVMTENPSENLDIEVIALMQAYKEQSYLKNYLDVLNRNSRMKSIVQFRLCGWFPQGSAKQERQTIVATFLGQISSTA